MVWRCGWGAGGWGGGGGVEAGTDLVWRAGRWVGRDIGWQVLTRLMVGFLAVSPPFSLNWRAAIYAVMQLMHRDK